MNCMHRGHSQKRAKRESRPVKSVSVCDIKRMVGLVYIEKSLQEKLTLSEKSLFQPRLSSATGLEICRAQLPRLNGHLHHAQLFRQLAFNRFFKARPAGCEKRHAMASPGQPQC